VHSGLRFGIWLFPAPCVLWLPCRYPVWLPFSALKAVS
jgi:hypothetical protein